MILHPPFFFFFFFNDTATTEIYTLSLHDALPISLRRQTLPADARAGNERRDVGERGDATQPRNRSEEHTSELQSQSNLVCRLLLEKKKKEHSLCFIPPDYHVILPCRALYC